MEDVINQGGEAFLLIFIIGGAVAMMLWLLVTHPKKFLKWILKDLVDRYAGGKPQEESDSEEEPREAPVPDAVGRPTGVRESKMKTMVVILVAALLAGCMKQDEKGRTIYPLNSSAMRYIVFDGHEYVMYDAYNRGSVCHSPKCECRKREGDAR